MELEETGILSDGIQIARNAFTKHCNEECIDEIIANGDKNVKSPLAIVRKSLQQVNEGGLFKVLYSYLAKSFFYAKHVVLHSHHIDELLRAQYQVLREKKIFEKINNLPRSEAFSTFVTKKRKQSIFDLTLQPLVKVLENRINTFCDFLPDIGLSLGVTVNLNLAGTCKFGVAELIRNFSVTAASWVRELFSRHSRLAFLNRLFFSPVNELNHHFKELVGKSILAQEKTISAGLKHVIAENCKSETVKARLLGEFEIIDKAFLVESAESELTREELLVKLDRIVLKATLLFDSDYIDDLSSGWLKKRVHQWAKREVMEVTSPVANIIVGELAEKHNERNAKSDRVHGRYGAKKREEKEKKQERETMVALKAFAENDPIGNADL